MKSFEKALVEPNCFMCWEKASYFDGREIAIRTTYAYGNEAIYIKSLNPQLNSREELDSYEALFLYT